MVLGKVLAGEKGRETFLRTGGKKTPQQCLRLFFCLFVLGGELFFSITLETACCCVIMLRVSLIAGA